MRRKHPAQPPHTTAPADRTRWSAATAGLVSAAVFTLTVGCSGPASHTPPEADAISSTVQAYLDAFNDGRVDALKDLSCGEFATAFTNTTTDDIRRQSEQARNARGRGTASDFRNTRIGHNTATTTATITYQHAANDPDHKGRTTVFDLEKNADKWQVCSYSAN
ncbi:hypothetical protein GZH49_12485 [Nocardia terpenica]|uniref:Rv0361 family membrane protein n=1 Tax=Nocardia terpenica TaxID=455432 RepID=UPI002FE0C7BC